ncbi:MAG TPA: carboxypeptidase-like regulatory domain-containing protein [Gemmataceae bacterium]|jgi:hypothetical protein|nr:carboxypeptidase-like regulatory domain-containing protein [Gemmataceae bacterium]
MRRTLTVLVVALLLVGCGPKRAPSGTVSGTVTYKGRPVNGAVLHFYPAKGGATETVMIPVNQEGAFDASGVPPGDYKVVVQPSAGTSGPSTKGMSKAKLDEMKGKLDEMKTPATIPIPKKVQDVGSTNLTCSVTTGKQDVTLEVKD